jgi:hypothetical protein
MRFVCLDMYSPFRQCPQPCKHCWHRKAFHTQQPTLPCHPLIKRTQR